MKKPSYSCICMLAFIVLFFPGCSNSPAQDNIPSSVADKEIAVKKEKDITASVQIDTIAYNEIMLSLSNEDSTGRWPVKAPYPLTGAILPYNRIVAFYGNLYSKRMGILGELPKKEMLDKLQAEVAKWQAADSSLPVIPALHYIAVTSQQAAGKDGKYRMRMPFHQIDSVINWAKEINALVFLDIQVGHSTIKEEVPLLEKYLLMPDVHLGIDPEFSMKNGETPGSKVGSFTDEDVNDAVDFLSSLVEKNNLPPKILIVHRFTEGMLTGYDKIKKLPQTQVVIDMDGWGSKVLKRSTYISCIYKEPVQFTGFKLFYKNDTKTGADQLYAPSEILKLTPKPVYIQYQ
ncbi:lipoprotein [soil metagenome]